MNSKHRRFVEEYLIDLNATKAAERAGYGKNSKRGAREMGHELLQREDVKAAVAAAQAERSARTEVTQDQVVNELRRIAFSKMADVASWNVSGVTFKPSDAVSEDALSAVQAVEEHTNQHGGSLKIKQYDKVKALELLGRHLGMFKEPSEVAELTELLKQVQSKSDQELVSLITKALPDLKGK